MAIARKPLMILGLAVGFFLAGALAEMAATKDVPTVQKLVDVRVTAARKAYEETALLYREVAKCAMWTESIFGRDAGWMRSAMRQKERRTRKQLTPGTGIE